MNVKFSNEEVLKVVKLIRKISRNLVFTIFEIGALPAEDQPEPFHQILDFFPNSRIYAFEVDAEVCKILNKETLKKITFYPVALGKTKEKRIFYETNHPMCGSLYKPNEELIKLYNTMDEALLKSTSIIETDSIDHFCKNNMIQDIDFIKIDVQGAELDVFKGCITNLPNIVATVCEVEFIQQYIDQPLFGDVCSFLANNNLMFHKFLTIGGRSLKPVTFQDNRNFPTQHMWSDAIFIRNILNLSELSADKLLKLGLISFIYGSPDVTYQCIKLYDIKQNTRYLNDLTKL